ncbi:MAG: glycosyltransferase family 4 protein [Promethearchaeota archaeon]
MAKLKKIPVIIWIGSTNKGESFFRKLFLPVIKLMITKSSIIIVYGTEAKKFVERLEAKERRIFIAYNTVPINHILATPKPKQKIYFKETKNILFVGRLIKIKGIDTLISAFKLLKSKINNSRLLIVGEGKQLHFLKKKCENLQIEKDVEFLGFLEGKDLTKIYQTADLFVLPSRWEIWGLVLNEAMAHGLPVIATNSCGASTDLIYPGLNGYVIPPNDPVILMKACNKILSNNNRAKKMGEYSKDIIKEFTIEKEAQAFIEAIKFILVNTKRQRDLKIDDNVKNYHIEK